MQGSMTLYGGGAEGLNDFAGEGAGGLCDFPEGAEKLDDFPGAGGLYDFPEGALGLHDLYDFPDMIVVHTVVTSIIWRGEVCSCRGATRQAAGRFRIRQ